MSVLTIIALLSAVAALGYAYLSQRKLADLSQRLSRVSSHTYELSSQIDDLGQQLESQGKELRFEIRKAAGQVRFEPSTTLGEVQAVHPFAEQILAGFHMGGCHNCAISPDETIAAACQRLNVNETALLAALRNGSPEPLRLANVELQF
jgi:hypothetical protein